MNEMPGASGKGAMNKKGVVCAVKTGGQFLFAMLGMTLMFIAALYAKGRELIVNVFDPRSIMGKIWRFSAALFDWRTHLRFLGGGGVRLDAVFISNMRDATDRERFLGGFHPPGGHFNGPRYSIKGVLGRTRALYVTADDLATSEGRMRAREQFIRATQWAGSMGAEVVLLAAGTKRLFDGDIDELKQRFPEMLFTIGDNGTSLLLTEETLRALEKARLDPGKCRIGVLGPYGFLGELMIKTLLNAGHHVVGAGPNNGGLEKIGKAYGIEMFRSFEEMGKVDAVVACTHSEKVRLTAENIDLIRRDGRKLLVVDVAEPANMTRREFLKCGDRVVRQDAGNAYAPGLKYVLGAISYRMFRLTRGVTFGCFAEALTLAWAMKHGCEKEVRGLNWMEVNEENMKLITDLFGRMGFRSPSPRSHSTLVKSFDLEMEDRTQMPRS